MNGTQYKSYWLSFTQSSSDWLFIIQSGVLQVDWMISNNDEKVTLLGVKQVRV